MTNGAPNHSRTDQFTPEQLRAADEYMRNITGHIQRKQSTGARFIVSLGLVCVSVFAVTLAYYVAKWIGGML